MQVVRFIKFAAVGAVGTVGHFATLTALVEIAHASPITGALCGFLVGAAINYVLDYRLTFHSRKRHREAAVKFFTVAGSGFLLTGVLMALLVNLLGLPYLLAQIITTGILLIWHYFLNVIWTFR